MSKTVQQYETELGLADAQQLQKNQERARRGKTPLEPTLTNRFTTSETSTKSYADTKDAAVASTAQSQATTAEVNAKNYADARDAVLIPSGSMILWDATGAIPTGWFDTGYTITINPGAVTRRVIRRT